MTTIQIALDDELLEAADQAAQETATDRSSLVRAALRQFLKKRERRRIDEQDRLAYERLPDTLDDLDFWERVAAWPDE